MSYDLNIWSRKCVQDERNELQINQYTLTIQKSVTVEFEDIPVNISLSLSEIQFLTTLSLQPYTNDQAIISKAIQIAKQFANKSVGILENPQENNDIYINKKQVFQPITKDSEIISVCWYTNCDESLSIHFVEFLNLIEKYLPQAMPRRYGPFEPPQYKFLETGKAHLLEFLINEPSPVLYCTKPVLYLFLSDAYLDNQKYNIKEYRCNKIELQILKEAYMQKNWRTAVEMLFVEVSKLYDPFYAEIIDENQSGVCSWWWKGIPDLRGKIFIIGAPYIDFLNLSTAKKCGNVFLCDERCQIPFELVSKKKLLKRKSQYSFNQDFNFAKVFPFKK